MSLNEQMLENLCRTALAEDVGTGDATTLAIVPEAEALKKEIQDYVKAHTAPYKYPRLVVFREELPKTISGKIIRSEL